MNNKILYGFIKYQYARVYINLTDSYINLTDSESIKFEMLKEMCR